MKNVVMPIYVVLDTSESMGTYVDDSNTKTRFDIALDIIPSLLEAMEKDASVTESLRVTLISFAQTVATHLISADYKQVDKWYSEKSKFIKCVGQTYYGEMFKSLKKIINDDINDIKMQGKQYYRPLVYFLTDGFPEGLNENKENTSKIYLSIVDNKADSTKQPVIFCVGIGDANRKELNEYGAGRIGTKDGEYQYHNEKMVFVVRKGARTGEGLMLLNSQIIDSIVRSFTNRNVVPSVSVREIDKSVFDGLEALKNLDKYFEIFNRP